MRPRALLLFVLGVMIDEKWDDKKQINASTLNQVSWRHFEKFPGTRPTRTRGDEVVHEQPGGATINPPSLYSHRRVKFEYSIDVDLGLVQCRQIMCGCSSWK
jgi:hypothetical protein